jgi:hypothetical protein
MSQLRNKLIIRFKPNPDSDALVRQSFRNAVGERRPRGGLEVLSGRSLLSKIDFSKLENEKALVLSQPLISPPRHGRFGVREHTRPACRFDQLSSARAPAAHRQNEVGFLPAQLVCEQGRTGVSAARLSSPKSCSLTTQLQKKAFSETWQAPWKLDPAGSGWPECGTGEDAYATLGSQLPT